MKNLKIVEPEVKLLAATKLWHEQGKKFETDKHMKRDWVATDSENLIEFAGRACYQSFSKPNPKTAENRAYIERTLFEQGHWSIAEHASATLYFTGVSRAFTHELIRHRHLSFSQQSQRFVDEADASIVLPPAIRESKSLNDRGYDEELGVGVISTLESLRILADFTTGTYSCLVDDLQDSESLSRKQAREAARAVLPNMLETRIVVTGNLRAWHEVIARRIAPDADAEMREVMGLARKQLEKVSPVIFGGDSDDAQQVSCENM